MSIESEMDRADDRTRRAASKRSIKLPGMSATFASTNPHDIARELRAKSKLGERERKIANS